MTDDTADKEANRVGTINRWDAPDEDWAADYPWTRHSGPAPYPVPDAWVLDTVEGDGVSWSLLPDAGEDRGTWSDAVDALGNPRSVDPEARALLTSEWPNQADIMEDDPYHELTIDGELVLVLEDDGEGWWRAVAEALHRYARDGDYQTVLEDEGLDHLKADPFDAEAETDPDQDAAPVSGADTTLADFADVADVDRPYDCPYSSCDVSCRRAEERVRHLIDQHDHTRASAVDAVDVPKRVFDPAEVNDAE